jgi:hypothetical protein
MNAAFSENVIVDHPPGRIEGRASRRHPLRALLSERAESPLLLAPILGIACCSFPPAREVVLLAAKHKVVQAEAVSMLLVSTLALPSQSRRIESPTPNR